MFFTTIIIISFVTLFTLMQVEAKETQSTSTWLKLIAAGCFVVSWGVIIMALTAMIERWQLALNTPLADQAAISVWGRSVQAGLGQLVFLLPVRRVTLGLIYALPIFLIPLAGLRLKQSHLTATLLTAAGLNWLFFWTHLLTTFDTRDLPLVIPIQGGITITTYLLLLGALLLQSQKPMMAVISRSA